MVHAPELRVPIDTIGRTKLARVSQKKILRLLPRFVRRPLARPASRALRGNQTPDVKSERGRTAGSNLPMAT
jgi:hypothetical protein